MPNAIVCPPKLTPAVALTICTAVSEGCYDTVAAARAGISRYTLYLWNEKGKRETQQRDQLRAVGKPADEPLTIYERFHLSLEGAKADARYDAETRVFRTAPLAWLKNGYARNDWRESDVLVRMIEDAVERRIADMKDAAFGLGRAKPPEDKPDSEREEASA